MNKNKQKATKMKNSNARKNNKYNDKMLKPYVLYMKEKQQSIHVTIPPRITSIFDEMGQK